VLQLCFPHMTGYIFRQFAASARYSPRQARPVARCRNSGKYIIFARLLGLSQEPPRLARPWLGRRRKIDVVHQVWERAYVRLALGFASLSALKPASQVFQDDHRGRVEGDHRRRLDREFPPDRFAEIGGFGRRIGMGLRLVDIAHADILDIGISAAFGKCGRTFPQPKEPLGNPGRKQTACAKRPLRLKQILRGADCAATMVRVLGS
jgi:hypothetical protein